MWVIFAVLLGWLSGVRDAVKLHAAFIFLLTSERVRLRAFQCFILNGVIFLGSMLLSKYAIQPLIRSLLLISPEDLKETVDDAAKQQLAVVSSALNAMFVGLFQILWIYPVYCISFILNVIWYQDIADHAYIIRGGVRPKIDITFRRWLSAMADEVYRLLVIGSFVLQGWLCSWLPYVGPAIAALHLCWLYSLYSFEYKWTLDGWELTRKLAFFERRWAYFAGFGFPSCLLTVLFPGFLSSGIFALCFPIFIIVAIIAQPLKHTSASFTPLLTSSPDDAAAAAGGGGTVRCGGAEGDENGSSPDHWELRLPIFRLAKILSGHVLRLFQAYQSSSSNSKSNSSNSKSGSSSSSSSNTSKSD